MGHRLVEFQAVLDEVRRRWTRLIRLRRWTWACSAALAALIAGALAVWFVARDGLPLLAAGLTTVIAALAGIGFALWPLRHRPSDGRLARFIEERTGGLDDVLPTAVEYRDRPDARGPMAEALAADAVRAVEGVDLDSVVPQRDVRGWAWRAAAASAALALVAALVAPDARRAASVAAVYLFPARLTIAVTPGSAKVPAGQTVTIAARVDGARDAVVPSVTLGSGDTAQTVRMERGEGNTYTATVEQITDSFPYSVAAASTRSPEYVITVVRPPRVERIDLELTFPKGLGLEPRHEEDSGDIYAPAGTTVRVTVTADKPLADAHLTLVDGREVALEGESQVRTAELVVDKDGSYRVALADTDGLTSDGDTEYFIRTLLDRPPDVRIVRPAGDRQVTPLEEVAIEAEADDDFGIQRFDLVVQRAGEEEKVIPFRGDRGGVTASGRHLLYLEDMGVQPGDFVTYYARARDVGRGRNAAEARSDIYFLEVKPFEEEFVAAQSQAMAQGGMRGGAMEDLAEAQKQIIVATWKLDARARRAGNARADEDIKAVSKAQGELKTRVDQASASGRRLLTPRRRRPGGEAPEQPAAQASADPMAAAAEAMGRAVDELDEVSTARALPHEMDALNELLKAAAEERRRQIARAQGGGGGGGNRQGPDLSTLFDQELRRRQETNYEMPSSAETRDDKAETTSDALERIRELARRQEALNRAQRDLADKRDQLDEAELKRQLERLTREQNDLRQQAEQLDRDMQQSGQRSGQQAKGGQGQSGNRGVRSASEAMREAAGDLRRQDAAEASERGARAVEDLRRLEREMRTADPDERRRALGDLQLETRQLADAERRLANEAAKTADGDAGRDQRRRLAGEQERLADRAERLEQAARELARTGRGQARDQQALEEAARELERQALAERMREAAGQLRGDTPGNEGEAGRENGSEAGQRAAEEMARALDGVAGQLGAAAGTATAESQRLSGQLSRAEEARQRIADLEQSIDAYRRAIEAAEAGNQDGQSGQQGESGQQGSQAAPSAAQQGQAGQRGQAGNESASSASSAAQQGNQSGSSAAQRGSASSASSAAQGGSASSAARAGNQSGASGAGGGGTGSAARLEQMRRDLRSQVREAEQLTDRLRRDNPGMQGGRTPEGWWPSLSAPGTEAFKQDFSRWESLKKNLLLALEQVESDVSDSLRAREGRDRLNAGGHEAVAEAYREQVKEYFRTLAAPRKPPQ